jgi:hypothetical protein
MNMIVHSADCHSVHPIILCNSCHIRPQFGLYVFRNCSYSVLCTETDVNVVADKGTRHDVASLRDS